MGSMVPFQAEKEKGLTEKAEDVAEKVQHTHTHTHTHKLMVICIILNGGARELKHAASTVIAHIRMYVISVAIAGLSWVLGSGEPASD